MRKLARVRDCLSFFVLSTRVEYMGIIRRHFPRRFFLFFFLLVLCFSVHKLYILAFPSQFFLLALPPFPTFSLSTSSQRLLFSLFLPPCFFFLLHQLLGSILCHATEQTIAEKEQEEEKKIGRKAGAVVTIIIVCIYLDRFFSLSIRNKKETNSCNKDTNR